MTKIILRPLRVLLVFSVLTGVAYPLLITGIAGAFFPSQAGGSVILKNEKRIGSSLIGQNFKTNAYFHGRPSAVDWNAASSGASNWGPTSTKLVESVKERIALVRKENPKFSGKEIPADLVLASASGLDPHISADAALLQVRRVAEARKLPNETVLELVRSNIEGRQWGFLGSPRVNVLKLNMALDDARQEERGKREEEKNK